MRSRSSFFLTSTLTVTLLCFHAEARTLELFAEDCDQMGAIAAAAPRQSWAMSEYTPGFFTTHAVSLVEKRSFLIRFPLDTIPEGHRIAYAELILPTSTAGGNEPRFYLWRLLADWGAGVSYRYRRTVPEKVEWAQPGARGYASDRAIRPTDILRVKNSVPVTVNVTEDVDLWYSGSARNNGWLLTVEDLGVTVSFSSPTWGDPKTWILRVTYEPKPVEP